MSLVQSMVEHVPQFARRVMPLVVACKLYGSMERARYLHDTHQALRQSGLYSRRVFLDACAVRTKFIADRIFVAHAKPQDIARLAAAVPPEDANVATIRRQLAMDRPFLFGCSYFGCVYFALLALKDMVRELLVVVAGDPGPGVHYFNRIAAASGIRITVAGTADRTVALRVLRHLGRGGAVATMLDSFHGERLELRSDFLGRPAASLGTLYELGHRAGAMLVPTASIRKNGKLVLEVGDLIDMRSTPAVEASQQVNDYFSDLVRAYPGQWMGWPNLLARWRMAHQTY